MKRIYVILSFGILIIGIAALTANRTDAVAEIEAPTIYDLETITKYRELASQGYDALDGGDHEAALASFKAQIELIPEGKLGTYNIACVHGRAGNIVEGIVWLEKTVENGWDSPDDLIYDTDLASLKSDPKFESLVAKSRATLNEKTKIFARGIPNYDKAPVAFESEEQFEDWADERYALIKKNRSALQGWQYTAVKLDFFGQKLAALRDLNADNQDFDYALERVRTIGAVYSPWDCWGPLTDGVVRESDSYLAGTPSPSGADEANYFAGLALSRQDCGDDPNAPSVISARKKANGYLEAVSEDSEYYGAAQAWMLGFKLQQAGEEGAEALYADVRKVIKICQNDRDERNIKDGMRAIAVGFNSDAIKASWPIELSATDVDGKEVSVDQYEGKVLLIDFWATWCGPCLAELPNLKRVYETYHAQGLEVLSVSLDRSSMSVDDFNAWTDKRGMPWRHVFEGKFWDDPHAAKFMVMGIPAAFLVGPDGELLAMGEECSGEKLGESVAKALERQTN